MKLAEFLPQHPNRLWNLSLQVGVTHAVSRLPKPMTGLPAIDDSYAPWDYMNLLLMRNRFEAAGLKLQVIEPGPDNWKIKSGLPGRDEEIEHMKTLIRNMGKLGIPVLCYSFMAEFRWMRTSTDIPLRGGALATGFNAEHIKDAPLAPNAPISEEQMWDHFKYFLERIVPVAEEHKVKLALHPDDPPVSSIRGIARIIRNAEAMQKALDLVPSEYNGITLCQGTLAAAGEHIPSVIEHFGKQNKIFFVHFRDIQGTQDHFHETFHDEGITDMFEAMKAYHRMGYTGPVRVDHVPTMDGESNEAPGYESMGRMYAIGYLKGLLEGARKS